MTMTQLTAESVKAHNSDPALGALARASFAKTEVGKDIVMASKEAAVFFFFGDRGTGSNDGLYEQVSGDVIFDAITLASKLDFVIDGCGYEIFPSSSLFDGAEDSLIAMLLDYQQRMQVTMTDAALKAADIAIAGSGCYGQNVLDVLVPDYVDYRSAEESPEWAWIEERASYVHKANGREDGVWEFFLNVAHLEHDLETGPVEVPSSLSEPLRAALAGGYGYILFHQGT